LNTSYVQGQSVEYGEFKPALLTATGPSSYAVAGDVVYNPASGDYINFPFDCTTQSGNYEIRFVPTTAGVIRAGAPSPSQSGWTAFWKYSGASNSAFVGAPLTLGPLSVAATTSAMTANGVGTVVVANSLSAGQIVLLTGGASGKAIFMNGQFVQVVTASAAQFTYNAGYAKALNYASAADTGLKFQLLQATSGNPVTLGTGPGQSIAVSAVAVASNVLTITCTNTGTTIVPGNFIVLQGLAAGEVPQGGIVQVLTANTTTLTANLIAPNLSATSGETGTATVLVTNGNAPIQATQDSFSINGSTVAATAASATAAGAITVLPVNQTLVPGNIVVVQGLTHGASLNGLITPVLAASLSATNITTNGYLAAAVTTGTGDLGALGLLMTGTPLNGNQVATGTNLSGETVQFGAIVSQL
jgi:hypothetical protein